MRIIRAWPGLLIAIYCSHLLSSAQDQKKDQDEEKYKKAAEGINLPSDSEMDEYIEKGESYKELIEWMRDRNNWAKAFKKIEEKLGLFSDSPSVKVSFSKDTRGYQMVSRGTKAKGYIKVNIESVATVIAGMKKGKAPGITIAGLFTHELVHTFQGFTEPLWLVEGWSEYAAGNTNLLITNFVYGKASVSHVDKASGVATYGRGLMFFNYLKEKHGEDKLKEFVGMCINKRTRHKEALEKVTGLKWDDLIEEEKEWSANWLKEFKESYKKKKNE